MGIGKLVATWVVLAYVVPPVGYAQGAAKEAASTTQVKQGRLVIYFPGRILGVGPGYATVSCNGLRLARLKMNTYVEVSLPAGEHKCSVNNEAPPIGSVNSSPDFPTKFTLSNGETVCLKVIYHRAGRALKIEPIKEEKLRKMRKVESETQE